ncbi:MAG TPA: hypothetical protein VN420_05220 [Candidatus Fimivivens sp.]|nr:hypothetical protein [Candidatus Fimivivens sp.]
MRKSILFLLVLTLFFVFPGAELRASGFGGTFSEGYRMGQLTKFSIKGLLIKSGEGQLLLGRESTPYSITTGDGTERINPWYFSADPSVCNTLNEKAGDYVVLHYVQSRVANTFVQDTDYTVDKVYGVTRKDPVPRLYEVAKDRGGKSEGVRVGRIVKVSYKGNVNKTYELMLQQGDAGNQFKHMTITDDGMYQYAIKVLMSGKKVKVYYVESFFVFPGTRDTNYQVWKIEVPEDL